LYVADLGEEMTPIAVSKFDKDVKSKFHEATPTLPKTEKPCILLEILPRR
jgi:hypothetical protein